MAEEPLPAGGSCLLGSLNLASFVNDKGKFDFNSFKEAVIISTQALDQVLDDGLPLHPLQEQRDSVKDWRQIGLGIFGLADMLIKMGIKYGSDESIKVCDKIGATMIDTAIHTSALMAKEKGAFPKCNNEEIISTEFCIYNTSSETYNLIKKYGLRNSQILTIAPTGSISTMLGVSGGIEPIFANYYTRKTESLHEKGDVSYKVYTPIVDQYMKDNGLIDESQLPSHFITAQNLNYHDRIRMQSTWQNHIDASISSTVNLPKDTTIQEVEDLYLYAWEQGCKGITIYRDQCKRSGILTLDTKDTEDTEKQENTKSSQLRRGDIISTTDDLLSYKRTINTGCGKFYLHTDFDEFNGEQLETFIDIGSGGGCERNLQFISRLISVALRGGIPLETIVDQALSIKPCTAYMKRSMAKKDTSKGSSCPSAIGYALLDLNNKIKDRLFCDEDYDTETNTSNINIEKEKTNVDNKTSKVKCPDCNGSLRFDGGCVTCPECGWSKCS